MLTIPLAYLISNDNDGTKQAVRFKFATWLKIACFAVLFGFLLAWLSQRNNFCEWRLASQSLYLKRPIATNQIILRQEISDIRLAFPTKHGCGVSIYTLDSRFESGAMACAEAKQLKEQLQLWRHTGNFD